MKKVFALISMVVLAFALAACSSGSSSGGGVTYTPGSVGGVAALGLVNGGTVTAYKIVSGEKGASLGTATTDEDGNYSINIGSYSGAVLLEITGGTYIDEATGNEVEFIGTLRAAVSAASGDVSVAVTPLTELAVRKAEPGSDGLTPEKIEAANEMISQILGADIIEIQPVDACDPDSADADDDQVEYGLLLAAIAQMAKDNSLDMLDQLDDLDDDLDDNIMDEFGEDLAQGLADFLVSEDNQTGVSEVGDLGQNINEVAQNGFEMTGDLVALEELLLDFLAEPYEDTYYAFMYYMDTFTPASQEASLYAAIAELFGLYLNEDFEGILAAIGAILDQHISIDTLDLIPEPDGEQIVEIIDTFLTDGENNIYALLDALLTQLDAIDERIEDAQGAHITLSLTGLDTVHLDDVDVKIMGVICKGLKTACLYLKTIDFMVEDWQVTVDEGPPEVIKQDLREIEELSGEQIGEFIENNPDLLTYRDDDFSMTAGLAAFRTAFADVVDQFDEVVDALDTLGESGRKARCLNAFPIATEQLFYIFKIINEQTFPSILEAFDDPEAAFVIFSDEVTSEGVFVADDGYAYWKDTSDISYGSFTPIEDGITICDLVQGDKSPHDILMAIFEDEDYQPYLEPEEGAWTLYQADVPFVNWENPIDTYTVPLATIEIDGQADDWDDVSTFYDNGYHQVKLARDNADNFYMYVYQKSPIEDDGTYAYDYESTLDMSGYTYGYWVGTHVEYNSDGVNPSESSVWGYDGTTQQDLLTEREFFEDDQSRERGMEVCYQSSLALLTTDGSQNSFTWSEDVSSDEENYSIYHAKTVKLLSESD